MKWIIRPAASPTMELLSLLFVFYSPTTLAMAKPPPEYSCHPPPHHLPRPLFSSPAAPQMPYQRPLHSQWPSEPVISQMAPAPLAALPSHQHSPPSEHGVGSAPF